VTPYCTEDKVSSPAWPMVPSSMIRLHLLHMLSHVCFTVAPWEDIIIPTLLGKTLNHEGLDDLPKVTWKVACLSHSTSICQSYEQRNEGSKTHSKMLK
jgi:hypothetical protein